MIYIVYYILRDFMIFFDRNEGIIICGHPVNGDHFYRFCEPESHIFFCIFPLRTFVIQQIPSSNLFMVVVENTCDCSSAPPVTMEPIEIIYILFINQLKPLLVEREVKA